MVQINVPVWKHGHGPSLCKPTSSRMARFLFYMGISGIGIYQFDRAKFHIHSRIRHSGADFIFLLLWKSQPEACLNTNNCSCLVLIWMDTIPTRKFFVARGIQVIWMNLTHQTQLNLLNWIGRMNRKKILNGPCFWWDPCICMDIPIPTLPDFTERL